MAHAQLSDIVRLFDALQGTILDGRMVLAGAAGPDGSITDGGLFTEDTALIVEEAFVRDNEEEMLLALEAAGLERIPGAVTFVDVEGNAFDLIAYSIEGPGTGVGGGESLKVMVFGDLSRVLSHPEAVERPAHRVPVLTSSALALLKLMTLNETGSARDKLEALSIIARDGDDPEFRRQFVEMLAVLDPDQWDDVLADSYAAVLALGANHQCLDAKSIQYRGDLEGIVRGYKLLLIMVGEPQKVETVEEG